MVGGPGVQGDLAKPVLVPATGRRRRSCQHRLCQPLGHPDHSLAIWGLAGAVRKYYGRAGRPLGGGGAPLWGHGRQVTDDGIMAVLGGRPQIGAGAGRAWRAVRVRMSLSNDAFADQASGVASGYEPAAPVARTFIRAASPHR